MEERNLLVTFGKNVQKERAAKKLSQEKLGELTGFHGTYIGMIERAERKVSIIAAAKVAKALGVSIDKLLND